MNIIKEKLINSFEIFSNCRSIVYEDRVLTYRDLQSKSLNVVNYLLDNNFSSVVIVFMNRKVETVIAILSIILSDKVFCSIDTNLSKENILEILKETESNVIITDNKNLINIPSKIADYCNIFVMENGEVCNFIKPEIENKKSINTFINNMVDLSHIIYTSGSTNKPKGVLASKKSLEHFISWEYKLLNLNNQIVNVVQISNPWFDPYARDIFLPLFYGGCICIPNNREMFDSKYFFKFVIKNNVNVIHIVPTLFRQIFLNQKYYDKRGIKYILLAGEMLFGDDIKQYNERYNDGFLYNLYGPTETTMSKFYHQINEYDEKNKHIFVGKALPDTYCKIIDNDGKELPAGMEGEILICTKYASLGYLKRTDDNLSHFSFCDNGFVEYKTNDMGILHESGELEIVGRKDNMKKIYGQKVHSEEIESVILEYSNIENCATYIKNNKIYSLIVAKNDFDLDKLVMLLNEKLQPYKIPEKIILVKKIPTNPNGKIDRRNLSNLNPSNIVESFNIHLNINKRKE